MRSRGKKRRPLGFMESLEARVVLDGGPIISEFMANNNTKLTDQDGHFSDWIEIHNQGPEAANLANWSLTDEADDSDKWRFPNVTIAAGDYLIVFASGKDRRIAGQELHTNFQLDSGGGYLALVQPDEETVASAFDPYPAQYADVSFGLNASVETTTLIAENSPVRVFIPDPSPGGNLPTGWTDAEFDDSAWIGGITPSNQGVGYETGGLESADPSAVLASYNPNGFWRFSETTGTTSVNAGTNGAALNGAFTGTPNVNQPGPRPPARAGFEIDNSATQLNGTSQYMAAGAAGTLSNLSRFTMMGWVRRTAAQPNRTGLWGQNDAVEFGFIDNATIQIWTPSTNNSLNVPWTFGNDGLWHHIATVADGTNIRTYIDGVLVGTGGAPTGSYGTSANPFRVGGGVFDDFSAVDHRYFAGDIDEVAIWTNSALTAAQIADYYNAAGGGPGGQVDYTPQIQTNVNTQMRNVNSSALVRIPFTIPDSADFDALSLNLRFDDGFEAYLNGSEAVASANAPVDLAVNSAATQRRGDGLAVTPQSFNLTTSRGSLMVGENVLAIHGLNLAADNPDFLLKAGLTATRAMLQGNDPRYFTAVTPGLPNGVGAAALGPIISNATHSPNVPTAAEPIVVTAKISQANAPISAVMLHYRVMYGATVNLGMVDNGSVGGDIAGDGIYTAVIPAGAAATGQMMRWNITATDTAASNSRWPLFYDPLDTEEYLGTVIADPSIASNLPVFQMFVVESQWTGVMNQTVTEVYASLFYDGEFYDNVRFDLHGQSSRGFPTQKKSTNIDFPADHRFRLSDDLERMKDINWLTNFADKTKLRNTLGYAALEEVGSPHHLAFPIRVQQNGQFWGVVDFVEDGEDVWIDRLGMNGDGSLYKANTGNATRLDNATGFEKKTRRNEPNTDITEFVAGIHLAGAAGWNYIFDNFDIPSAIGFGVGSALGSNYDCCHKNFYMHRDVPMSEGGTGIWTIIPWDLDLSWSHAWSPTNYRNDANVFNQPLFLGRADETLSHNDPVFGNINLEVNRRNYLFERLYGGSVNVPAGQGLPGFREMYLRRLRTVMDTFLQPTAGHYEEMIDDLAEQIGNDAALDNAKWASWGANQDWTTQVNMLKTEYLPQRRNFLFNTLSSVLPAPQPGDTVLTFGAIDFNPFGGNQDQEYIQITNPNSYAVDISDWTLTGEVEHTFRPGTVIPAGGSLYVTPDIAAFRTRTSGPRGSQGLFIQGGYDGHLSSFGGTLTIYDTTGREAATTTYAGNPSPQQLGLRITEVMYNPAEPTLDEVNAGYVNENLFEYIELQNIGATTLDLTGAKFTGGVAFDFTSSAVTGLAPGGRVLVVRDVAAFTARYGAPVVPIAGVYTGGLDNAGEILKTDDANNSTIQQFDYEDDWYPQTDGGGFSLVVRSETQDAGLWDTKLGWRPSNTSGGTPGADDTFTVPAPEAITFNEVMPHTTAPVGPQVEFYNSSAAPIDLNGWYLSDDPLNLNQYRVTGMSPIPAGGYGVLTAASFGGAVDLSANGGQLILTAADFATQEARGYQTAITYGGSDLDTTHGPYTNSEGETDVVELASPSLGAANSGPRIGPIAINEVHYNPAAGFVEYIELHNPTPSAVSLNGWSFGTGVTYTFGDVSVPAGGYLLVVPVDPATFTAPAGVPVVGPYTGVLDNGGENLSLVRPGDVAQSVIIDHLRYDDATPWPASPDGTGPSLSRLSATAYGNDPINWGPGSTTPGAPNQSFDESPPTVPQDVVATVSSGPMVSLTWSPSTDPQSGIAFYSIYRDGILLQTTTGTQFTQTGLSSGTTYTYQVSATNASNITSARGGPAPVRLMTVLSAAKTGNTQVRVAFSEGVTAATANDPANYFIGGLPITAAVLQANGTEVLLTTGSPVQQGQPYRVTVTGVRGTNPGSVIAPNSQAIFTPGVSNGLLGEYYDDPATSFTTPPATFPFGTKVGERVDPFPVQGISYLGSPTTTAPYTPFVPPLPIPSAANTFGIRWTGKILAPMTGAYNFSFVVAAPAPTAQDFDGLRFWIDADRDGQFEDIPSERLVNAWPATTTAQPATAINLTGGEKYDIRIDAYDNQLTFTVRFNWQHPGQATPAIVPVANLFTPTVVESDPPAVTGVQVRGSAWTPAFLSALQTAGLGTGGVDLPLGGTSGVIPWTGVNQVSVRFDEDVDVNAGDLVVGGVNVPAYNVAAFDYDPRTFTATWTLAQPLDSDRLTLNFATADDLAGNDVTGAATAIGRALAADVDRDGDVDIADFQSNRAAQFSSIGSPGYSVFQDTDGNGAINVLDWQNALMRMGTSLPAPAPSSAPSAVLARVLSSRTVATSAESTTAARPLRVTREAVGRIASPRVVDAAVAHVPVDSAVSAGNESATTLRARRVRAIAPRSSAASDAGLLSFLRG